MKEKKEVEREYLCKRCHRDLTYSTYGLCQRCYFRWHRSFFGAPSKHQGVRGNPSALPTHSHIGSHSDFTSTSSSPSTGDA